VRITASDRAGTVWCSEGATTLKVCGKSGTDSHLWEMVSEWPAVSVARSSLIWLKLFWNSDGADGLVILPIDYSRGVSHGLAGSSETHKVAVRQCSDKLSQS
jgi:hypothetical protein